MLILGLLFSSSLATPTTKTVYIMRHCVRSQFFPALEYLPNFRYLSNYSDGGPLPDFGVAPSLCTARGRRIIAAQGKSMAREIAERSSGGNLKVIYDGGAKRDRTTAEDFLSGAGHPLDLAKPDATIFNPQRAHFCPYPTAVEYQHAIATQLDSVKRPADLDSLLHRLQAKLGQGVAPPIPSLNSTISSKGYWLGREYVASGWAETMLLQYGSGLPVGYGRVSPSELYDFLALHVYYRAVNNRGFVIEQRGQSNLLMHMLDDLASDGKGNEATLYVGHDTQLDGLAVLLNLTWEAPPYPADTTTPGSMLRLTRTGEGPGATVQADYLYATFENEDGEMKVAASTRFVSASGASSRSLPLPTFAAAVRGAVDWRCVRNATQDEGVPTVEPTGV